MFANFRGTNVQVNGTGADGKRIVLVREIPKKNGKRPIKQKKDPLTVAKLEMKAREKSEYEEFQREQLLRMKAYLESRNQLWDDLFEDLEKLNPGFVAPKKYTRETRKSEYEPEPDISPEMPFPDRETRSYVIYPEIKSFSQLLEGMIKIEKRTPESPKLRIEFIEKAVQGGDFRPYIPAVRNKITAIIRNHPSKAHLLQGIENFIIHTFESDRSMTAEIFRRMLLNLKFFVKLG